MEEEIKIAYTFDGYEYEIAHVKECIRRGMKESDVVPLESSTAALRIVDELTK